MSSFDTRRLGCMSLYLYKLIMDSLSSISFSNRLVEKFENTSANSSAILSSLLTTLSIFRLKSRYRSEPITSRAQRSIALSERNQTNSSLFPTRSTKLRRKRVFLSSNFLKNNSTSALMDRTSSRPMPWPPIRTTPNSFAERMRRSMEFPTREEMSR
uniref:Uncharacterized protein n=1 Tax=Opuntia streptacantha TaxID=393608 RepID=A0A7C9CQR3_OPUST